MRDLQGLARGSAETAAKVFKEQLDALAEQEEALQAAQVARNLRNERYRARWLEGFRS